MSCKLRFYNAIRADKFGKKLTIIDRAILLRSNPHTHCEFQFSGRYDSVSFSATMLDGSNCCRFKDIKYSHPERWDTLDLKLTAQQEDAARLKAFELEDKKYDLVGLLSFASELNLIKPDPNKYWCSEADAELIKAALCCQNDFVPDKFTPTGLFFEMFYKKVFMKNPCRECVRKKQCRADCAAKVRYEIKKAKGGKK